MVIQIDNDFLLLKNDTNTNHNSKKVTIGKGFKNSQQVFPENRTMMIQTVTRETPP